MSKHTNHHLQEEYARLTFLTSQLENDIQLRTAQLDVILASRQKRREEELLGLRKELARWEHSRPAHAAFDDRRRKKTTWIRPLTPGEQEIQHLRGGFFVRLLILVLTALPVPFVGRIARRRAESVRRLRHDELQQWHHTIRSLNEQIRAAEDALVFPPEDSRERELRREITMLTVSLRQNREKREDIQAQLFVQPFLTEFSTALRAIPHEKFLLRD